MKPARLVLFASSFAAAAFLGAMLVAQANVAHSSGTGRPVEALQLGTVHFPTSGAAAAQPHFLHGIAALHSFWYEEALEAFARATEVDPQFAMAHWGEAMCYHRSFRPGSDVAAGRTALAKIKDTSPLTKREQAFLAAARALFGTSGGFKTADYIKEMEQVHRAHPDDHEAAAFYALALLSNRNRANMDKAGELARGVYRQNPNHPGAAHYIIHSYDDPAHASRALDAAYHYSKIAPDAPHALHMPSHIFLQLGMWHEAAASNDVGWAASVDYVKRKALTPTLRDYHNLHWLIYASLQQGRYSKATALVEEFVQMRDRGELASYSARYVNGAFGGYIIETRRWDQADALFASKTPAPPSAAAPTTRGESGRELEICGAEPPPPKKTTTPASPLNDTATFIRAYAAAARGLRPADDSGAESKKSGKSGSAEVRAKLIRGVALAQAKDFPAAIAVLREAAEAEAKTSRSPGPPTYKPAHELLGEVLLAAREPAQALAQFQTALERHPGRALSLLGRARAEAALGDKAAARATYAKLLEIWKFADADLPELHEARAFTQATG